MQQRRCSFQRSRPLQSIRNHVVDVRHAAVEGLGWLGSVASQNAGDVTPDGKKTIFAFIEEGELFGELALLDSQPRNEYAEAVADSQVLVILRDDLLWLMGQKPEVALRVTKLVGLRRRRIENRLRNIIDHTGFQRTPRAIPAPITPHHPLQSSGLNRF